MYSSIAILALVATSDSALSMPPITVNVCGKDYASACNQFGNEVRVSCPKGFESECNNGDDSFVIDLTVEECDVSNVEPGHERFITGNVSKPISPGQPLPTRKGPTGMNCFRDITNHCEVQVLPENVTVKLYQTCIDPNHVALTFDDGPNNFSTPVILDYLKAYNINATFFVVGNMVDRHPDVLRRIFEEGHMIGTHTYTHPHLTQISHKQVVKEMVDVP